MKRLRIVLLAFISLFVLAACAAGKSDTAPLYSPLARADFPVTIGGGFPVAQVVDASPAVEVGQSAPNFAFVWEDGRGMDLIGLRGTPVIINFWATWCGPCRAEMPEFVALHTANTDLVVLEINTQESLATIRPFAEEFGMAMPVVLDEAGAVRMLYGVRNMPTTLFIDAQGVLQARWAGLLTGEQLGEFVTQILAN